MRGLEKWFLELFDRLKPPPSQYLIAFQLITSIGTSAISILYFVNEAALIPGI